MKQDALAAAAGASAAFGRAEPADGIKLHEWGTPWDRLDFMYRPPARCYLRISWYSRGLPEGVGAEGWAEDSFDRARADAARDEVRNSRLSGLFVDTTVRAVLLRARL
jgi:hypothetical protein